MKRNRPLCDSGRLEDAIRLADENNVNQIKSLDKTERDHPLTYHSQVEYQRIENLGLPQASSKKLSSVRNAIITDVMIAHERGQHVSFSRNNNYYAETARYRSIPFSRGNIFATVDLLRERRLIEENRAKPGDHMRTQRQSTIWATPKLVESWGDWLDAALTYDPHETIRLKNADGDLIDYRESDERRRQRREMREYNEALSSIEFTLNAPDVEWNNTLVRVPTEGGGLIVLPWRKTAYRVFKGGWQLGGRLYGPFFQGLPKARRAQLCMNGSAVEEPDHSQMHARLLYAEFGLRVDGDAYTVPGHDKDRRALKVAWQIMINASDRRAGVWALAVKLAQDVLDRNGEAQEPAKFLKDASTILDLLEARHNAVASAFYTGAGLRLQRTDSEMCMRLVKRLLKEGIVAASIHDSFLVQSGCAAGQTRAYMDDELARATNTPKPCPVKVSDLSVLHMEKGRGSGAGARGGHPCPSPPDMTSPAAPVLNASVGTDLPPLPARFAPMQLSFLGLIDDRTPELDAVADAMTYEGGLIPETVIRFIRDRRKRDGISQLKIARKLGTSQPHYANAERRRSGLSPKRAAVFRQIVTGEVKVA